MNIFWLLVQQVEAEAAEAPSVFNLNLGTSFWTLIIFFTLLFVLTRWAFPPILGYAQAREERIQRSLDEARQAQEEAQKALEDQRRELAQAREQSHEIIAQGKQDAERVRQELLNKTKSEQKEVVDRAKQEIEREREQALEALRRQTVELSIAAASHLVSRRMDADEDRRVVREFLERAESGTADTGAGAS